MISQDTLQKNFPSGIAVPEGLVQLLDYANRVETFFSGDFEFTDDGAASVLAWFDQDQAAASQFAIFGVGGDQSLYGYWLPESGAIETAPIVFLGSEGESTILAQGLEDFLALLSLGIEELGYVVLKDLEWTGPEEVDKELLAFRQWLKTTFNIEPPTDWRGCIAEAQQQHPDLKAWLNEWATQHFGTL